MLREDKIWIATKATGEAICLLPKKANRHGLITGVSNKEVDRTTRILAEGFSSLGTPVFITDINRDLAGMIAPGNDSESIQETVSYLELEKNGFCFQGFPVTLWDVCGETGIPLRANIGEMGPVLLSQIMQLSAHQSDTLKTIFRVADSKGLSLTHTSQPKNCI